jgi:hypothetical protein
MRVDQRCRATGSWVVQEPGGKNPMGASCEATDGEDNQLSTSVVKDSGAPAWPSQQGRTALLDPPRDVLSQGPALGANAVTQRVHLAGGAAYLHHVSAATLPAAHGERRFEHLSGFWAGLSHAAP